MDKFISESADDTRRIAAEFAHRLKPGDVICMYGELGAGKTAFVQGLASGLNISGYVSSPTFTIVNEYGGDMPLYHFDVYRIGDSEEMFDIGFDEYINSEGITVIEWAELIEDILPPDRYNITIRRSRELSETHRIIEIEV